MGYLFDLGITKTASGNTSAQCLEHAVTDIFAVQYSRPSEYIAFCWEKYKQLGTFDGSINGSVFEYILATLFVRENLLPLYLQAKVAFVPNVEFDLLIYTKQHGPVSISAKTSLRERYKQADLEALALKNVHRRSKSYLVTLSEDEAPGVKSKIASGDLLGLEDLLLANTPEFDRFISKLKEYELIEPETVRVVSSSTSVPARFSLHGHTE